MVPGVVKPVTPTRTGPRRRTLNGLTSRRVVREGMEVGADIGKGGIGQGALQLRHAPVEVVVARRRGVVAGEVHRLDDRIGAPPAGARVVGGVGIALEQVAGVEHDHLSRVAAAERVHHRGHAGQPAGPRLVREVVPRGGAAVHVGRGDEHDVGTVRSLGGGE